MLRSSRASLRLILWATNALAGVGPVAVQDQSIFLVGVSDDEYGKLWSYFMQSNLANALEKLARA
jgi:hypothetical protein